MRSSISPTIAWESWRRLWGAPSLTRGLIALNGEVGYQPQVLRGGIHYFFPFQFRVHRADLVTIPQGEIGYIFTRDGRELVEGQALGEIVDAGIEDAAAFLKAGGQKGPQRAIIREGTHAINVAQFVIITASRVHGLLLSNEERDTIDHMGQVLSERKGFTPVVIGGIASKVVQGEKTDGGNDDASDVLGVVTIQDGPVLPPDEIVAPRVGEDPSNKVRSTTTSRTSTHSCAPAAIAVVSIRCWWKVRTTSTGCSPPSSSSSKTVVPVGSVGVVVSYFGKTGADRSGDGYSHGELVDNGCRGVWKEPLLPGKYAFNTYAGKIQLVPTTNFILKWSKEVTNAHKYDENLSEVALITKDAFEPLMPLSVVVHIDYRKAPLVVQRFGDIKRLVDQTLDPMVSAYFKNTGQTKTLIELLQERSAIQEKASVDMKGTLCRLQPRAAGGADRHAARQYRRCIGSAHRHDPEPAARPPSCQGANGNLRPAATGRRQGTHLARSAGENANPDGTDQVRNQREDQDQRRRCVDRGSRQGSAGDQHQRRGRTQTADRRRRR
jgi:hypothetical protein